QLEGAGIGHTFRGTGDGVGASLRLAVRADHDRLAGHELQPLTLEIDGQQPGAGGDRRDRSNRGRDDNHSSLECTSRPGTGFLRALRDPLCLLGSWSLSLAPGSWSLDPAPV